MEKKLLFLAMPTLLLLVLLPVGAMAECTKQEQGYNATSGYTGGTSNWTLAVTVTNIPQNFNSVGVDIYAGNGMHLSQNINPAQGTSQNVSFNINGNDVGVADSYTICVTAAEPDCEHYYHKDMGNVQASIDLLTFGSTNSNPGNGNGTSGGSTTSGSGS